MTAKEMFEELGFEYDYIQGECCEDHITYNKGDKRIQFNLISKTIVFEDNTPYAFYSSLTFFVDENLLKAINKQIQELRYNDDET